MTPEQQKEEISKAYLRAVAAECAFNVGEWSQDDGCIDVTIRASRAFPGATMTEPAIHVQLKCTSQQDLEHDGHVRWRMSRKHFQRMTRRSANPYVLVLLILPPDGEHAVVHTPEQLLIRRCAWWKKMSGEEWTGPEDADTTTVRLPAHQMFGPAALEEILAQVSRDEF